MLKRKKKAAEAENFELDDADLSDNTANQNKQKYWLYGGGAIFTIAAMWWILSPTGEETITVADADGAGEVQISTDALINRQEVDQNWMSSYDNQLMDQENRLKGVEHNSADMEQMKAELEALRAQNDSMVQDGSKVMEAYQRENEQLRRQIEEQMRQPPAGPAPQIAVNQAGLAPGQDTLPNPRKNEIKLISFQSGAAQGTAKAVDATQGATVYSNSPNFLPPNSIAQAKVIVGVDAKAGVKSQSDPLPVLLRITGPARSVYANGKLLRTSVEGCMVNGAAYGDLSAEKVYVKLLRMTCPQPGGRFAVSEVKGFVAFGGKTGVRGRVVSREGGLLTQAFLAGIAGGFGRGFAANANSVFTGASVAVNGERDKLSSSEILQGGLGEGFAQAGDTVSNYLIERAEQYQPVIEMATGADVEVVFLDGVFIRN